MTIHPLILSIALVFVLLFCVAGFFFVFTRGTLLARKLFRIPDSPTAHVYPVYSEMWLIKLIDFQPLISALLLLQYERLVDHMVRQIADTTLAGKHALITSCAFGNVVPRIVGACHRQGIAHVTVTDIVQNELTRMKEKLELSSAPVDFVQDSAVAMSQGSESVDVNVLFFLLHELPPHLQEVALYEAGRVLSRGGKLLIAEFHRPDSALMRTLSKIYFAIFEPYGRALWGSHDPIHLLEQTGSWECARATYFFGNYQVISATKCY